MLVRHWPGGHPRILVADAWLANAGDGAIALATQERLERIAPAAAVVHAAYQGDLLADAYPQLALAPPLAGLLGVTPTIPEMRGWSDSAGEQLVSAADVVLSQGGGFAMEHYDPWERLRAWELIVEMGLPLAFAAQSVGPFERDRERAILRRVYRAAEVVCVRERESAANVLELGARDSRIEVTTDEVFGLFPAAGAHARSGVACVLSSHPQLRPDGVLPRVELDDLRRLVVRLLDWSGDEHVTLFSTQQGLGDRGRGLEDDSYLAEAVVAELDRRHASRVRVERDYLSPQRCAELIASHRALCSMRMHPAIFGVCLGVPTVLASEAFKATALFSGAGLDDLLASASDHAAIVRKLDAPPADAGRARALAARNDGVLERLLAAV
jgi:polysaccharide pyruvyl transferase WcaK-like protein